MGIEHDPSIPGEGESAELAAAARELRRYFDAVDERIDRITDEEVEARLQRFMDGADEPGELLDPVAAGDWSPSLMDSQLLAEEILRDAREEAAETEARARAMLARAQDLCAEADWNHMRTIRVLNGAVSQASARIEGARREAESIVEEARRHAAEIREEARTEARKGAWQLTEYRWLEGRRRVVVLDSCFGSGRPAIEFPEDAGRPPTATGELITTWLKMALDAGRSGAGRSRRMFRLRQLCLDADPRDEVLARARDLESRVRAHLEELQGLEGTEDTGSAEPERVPILLRAPFEWAPEEGGKGTLIPARDWDDADHHDDAVDEDRVLC